MTARRSFRVRNLEPKDFESVIEICRRVYPHSWPWDPKQLSSHISLFPEGQLVIVDAATDQLVGMASSLIVLWNDYEPMMAWRDFTDHGYFTNHDPVNGKTLYGAEIFVDPSYQGQGAGKLLYEARFDLCRRLNLKRIRAGARLPGYHLHAPHMTAREYADQVIQGKLSDPTLSFQLKRGFHVLDVVSGYLKMDPESLGYAALIEWTNPDYRD